MMEYNTIFAKSFSRYEQKKLGYGAFLACLFVAFSFFTICKPSLTRLPLLNLQLTMRASLAKLMIENASTSQLMIKDTNTSKLMIQYAHHFERKGEMKTNKVENATSQIMPNTSEFQPQDSSKTKSIVTTSLSKPSQLPPAPADTISESKAGEAIIPVVNVTFQNLPNSTQIPVEDSMPEKDRITEIIPVCNAKEQCEIKGDVRVHGKSSAISFASSQTTNNSWRIRPYSRKTDKFAMSSVSEFILKPFDASPKQVPQCMLNHSVPAVVFSTGGYSGNHFHDFSDILVPLFLTSNQFHGEVQFLVTNVKSFWLFKYQDILKHLSNYEIIDIDKEDAIHCFPKVIVGLQFHQDLTIDPSKSPNGYTMEDFKHFLRSSYSLKREKAITLSDRNKKKPRLLIISRKRTRSFTNEGEIVRMARNLGYQVVVEEPVTTRFMRFAQIVNSCDVIMGVHGAGLTNILFLPSNAILIQIVPLGGMNWLSKHYFGEPSVDMNIRYLEYVIKEDESTLIQQYPSDHAVFKDPLSISKQGWNAFKAVYLEKQNVKLDVDRFRTTLLEALELLHNKI